MTVAFPSTVKMSFDEFLELEEQAVEKHEFINGKRIVVAGASTDHNDIAINIYAFLDAFFFDNGDECRVTNSDTMVFIPDYNKGRYPDATVVKGDYQHYKGNKKVIVNPILIFEVLSTSTSDVDETSKFDEYQTIKGFQEYVLIRKDKPYVKTYFREAEDLWRVKIIEELEASATFRSIGVEMPLKRIYRKVQFEE